jgi:phosphate-selective porin OprO/OprP
MSDRVLGRRGRLVPLALAGLVLGSTASSWAREPTRKELEERIRRLERIIEEAGLDKPRPKGAPPAKVGAPAEPPAPAVDQQRVEAIVDEKLKKQKVLAGWKDGFYLESADGEHKLKLNGYAQVQTRFFPNEDGDTGTDSIFLRRMRPTVEATVFKYFDVKIQPDFGRGRAELADGYLDVRYFGPEANLRMGKMKVPLSLERLQSGSNLAFVERSIANRLTPNRDIGLQLHGGVGEGAVTYQAGVFNGVNDNANGDGDVTSDKEMGVRAFYEPFKKTDVPPLKGFGLGVGTTYGGQKKGDNLNDLSYRTAGDARFFRFDQGSGIVNQADGTKFRIAPQAYWYWGPFHAMGEYVRNDAGVRRAVTDEDTDVTTVTDTRFVNDGFFVQAGYVVTGENASYKGVVPTNAFDPRNGKWGAFEVALRGSRLRVDDDLFDRGFADAGESSSDTWAGTVGLNWYLNKNFKFQMNYEYTGFEDHIEFGDKVRDHENVLLGQFQLQY